MIKKELAIDLIPLVNDLDSFKALLDYANYRIEQSLKTIENSNDLAEIQRAQGAIRELRRFTSLRDEVLTDSRR